MMQETTLDMWTVDTTIRTSQVSFHWRHNASTNRHKSNHWLLIVHLSKRCILRYIRASPIKIQKRLGFSSKIEVECRDLEEAYEAAIAGADIVMLDNFSPEEIKRDSKIFKDKYPHVIVEARQWRQDTQGAATSVLSN